MQPPYDREDVRAILRGLFDIRADVKDIRDYLLGDQDGEEEEEGES